LRQRKGWRVFQFRYKIQNVVFAAKRTVPVIALEINAPTFGILDSPKNTNKTKVDKEKDGTFFTWLFVHSFVCSFQKNGLSRQGGSTNYKRRGHADMTTTVVLNFRGRLLSKIAQNSELFFLTKQGEIKS